MSLFVSFVSWNGASGLFCYFISLSVFKINKLICPTFKSPIYFFDKILFF